MNKRFKVIFGLLFVAYFIVYLFSLSFIKEPKARTHERIIVAIASPLQRIVGFTYEKISSVVTHYFLLVGKSRQNDELQAEIGELRQKLVQSDEFALENKRLRTLLEIEALPKYTAINAERIADSSNEFEHTMMVNKGSNEKVAIGMPVINSQGIVGQVAKVFGDYSNILLLSDKSSSIDVIIQRTRSRGTLRGFTQHQLSFEFLSVDEDLQVGDIIISSGLDGVYPEGIPVGKVSAAGKQGRRLFLTATVDPYVNFSKVEEVRILAPVTRREF